MNATYTDSLQLKHLGIYADDFVARQLQEISEPASKLPYQSD